MTIAPGTRLGPYEFDRGSAREAWAKCGAPATPALTGAWPSKCCPSASLPIRTARLCYMRGPAGIIVALAEELV